MVVRPKFGQEALAVGDVATEAIRLRIPLQSRSVERVDLIDDGRKVRANLLNPATLVREVSTFDAASGAVETTRTVRGPGSARIWQPVFAPDGRTWAYLNPGLRAIQFWDSEADQPIGPALTSPDAASPALAWRWARSRFTPDGRTLLAGRTDGQVEFWDVAGMRRVKVVRLHPRDHKIYSLDVTPDGRMLASDRDRPAVRDPTRSTLGDHQAPGPGSNQLR